MSFHLATSDNYDISAFIPFKGVSLYKRVLLNLSLPIYLPKAVYTLIT
jgi:hypothetical protein